MHVAACRHPSLPVYELVQQESMSGQGHRAHGGVASQRSSVLRIEESSLGNACPGQPERDALIQVMLGRHVDDEGVFYL